MSSENKICLEYYPIEEMVADVLRKGLSQARIEKMRMLCGIPLIVVACH